MDEQSQTPAPGVAGKTVERGLILARATVIVPVVVLALAALGAFVYATDVAVEAARHIVRHPVPARGNTGEFLAVVDLFLVGTTLLISAIGLYELFLKAPGTRAAHLPPWLEITDLNDLKARVISMVVLVAAVTFVETIVKEGPAVRTLDTGVAIAVVVLALTAFVRLGETRRGGD